MSSVTVADVLKRLEKFEWLQLIIDGKLYIDEVNDGSYSAKEYELKRDRVLVEHGNDIVESVTIDVIEQHHYLIKISLEKGDNRDEILPF